MLDLMQSLRSWPPAVSGERCAVATIVAAAGSVPRPLGTSMIVSEHGEILGSLSGGCVEGAVVESALEAMRCGSSRLESFGYSAEDAFAAGLSCGGELDIHIQPFPVGGLHELGFVGKQGSQVTVHPAGTRPEVGSRADSPSTTPAALIRRLDAPRSAVVVYDPVAFSVTESSALATLLDDDAGLVRAAAAQLGPLLRGGRAGLVRLSPSDGCGVAGSIGRADGASPLPEPVTLFVESRLPPARMLIFGANDFGAALLPAARLLGYHVTLCDARVAFASQDRFRDADEVATEWPHLYLQKEAEQGGIDARTVICVLTHDPKFDIPLLETALRLPVAYVGAMGSRRSHRHRIEALLDAGTSAEALSRLHSPIGLDLGAVTPAEVAVSITAEIVAARGRGSLAPLKDGTGPIHSAEPLFDAAPQSIHPNRQEESWT
ncbi:XdhC family protein [Arthrobacter sp. M4]|uniref:XdhC family protein n=1 Tax=Arthrobacter sp. M4 TaxID=218160 RepID=UPI001CDD6995|nr:XdhC/CoxI family protein [Arthrobacter sp. M4]MCA4135002.1 XdhC family protein [Arthrobacter sp. M4]